MALGTVLPNHSTEKFPLSIPLSFGSVSLEALSTNGRMPQCRSIAIEHSHLHVGLLRLLNQEAEKRVTVLAQVLDIVYLQKRNWFVGAKTASEITDYIGRLLHTFLPIVLVNGNLYHAKKKTKSPRTHSKNSALFFFPRNPIQTSVNLPFIKYFWGG